MTALVAVASHVPAQRIAIEDLAERFELTTMQMRVFRKYHKLGEVARDPDGTLADLLRAGLANLAELTGQEQRVHYVLYARMEPVVVPFPLNPLHEVCREFGLGHAQMFTVTQQACAAGLLAIDLAGRLLATDPDPRALALILAGEKTFTNEAFLVPETSVFGEGASACLVAADGPADRLLSYAGLMRGDFDGEVVDPAAFQREYHDCMAEAITAAVGRAGLQMSDIGLILPHNVNVVAWRQVCRKLGYPLENVLLDHVATYGHVFCADPFINYQTAIRRGMLAPGERYLMAGAGAAPGAIFSAMVFEH